MKHDTQTQDGMPEASGMKSEYMQQLSARQKAVICLLAGRSYNRLGAAMGFADVTEWRHATVFDVASKDGLTLCDQLDYIPLYNYHAQMLGLPLREDRTPRNAVERALWVLRDALARWEFSEGYAAAIMRDRLGVLATEGMPLTHLAALLGAEGTRQVAYTVINRGRAKHKAELEAGAQEPHVSRSTLPPGGLKDLFGAVLAKPVQGRRKGRARKAVAHG